MDLLPEDIKEKYFVEQITMHYLKEISPHSKVDLYYGQQVQIALREHRREVAVPAAEKRCLQRNVRQNREEGSSSLQWKS